MDKPNFSNNLSSFFGKIGDVFTGKNKEEEARQEMKQAALVRLSDLVNEYFSEGNFYIHNNKTCKSSPFYMFDDEYEEILSNKEPDIVNEKQSLQVSYERSVTLIQSGKNLIGNSDQAKVEELTQTANSIDQEVKSLKSEISRIQHVYKTIQDRFNQTRKITIGKDIPDYVHSFHVFVRCFKAYFENTNNEKFELVCNWVKNLDGSMPGFFSKNPSKELKPLVEQLKKLIPVLKEKFNAKDMNNAQLNRESLMEIWKIVEPISFQLESHRPH